MRGGEENVDVGCRNLFGEAEAAHVDDRCDASVPVSCNVRLGDVTGQCRCGRGEQRPSRAPMGMGIDEAGQHDTSVCLPHDGIGNIRPTRFDSLNDSVAHDKGGPR